MRRRRTWQERTRRVQAAWERIEDAEPDISTERLMALVADATGEDEGNIAAMLAQAGEDEP